METRQSVGHYRQQAIFNILALLIVIGVNAMANLSQLNGKTTGEVSDAYPNLFVPAGFTFSIWSIIYLGLLGFVAYQYRLAFFNGHAIELQAFMVRMKGWFLLSCLGNACWLFAWHYNMIFLSFCCMLVLLASLIVIHRKFRIGHPGAFTPEKVFIHFPFGIYLGWISIATIANLTALLVAWNIPIPQVTWTVVMMGLGTLLAVLVVFRYNNVYYALVCIWAFYGIIVKRESIGGRECAPIVAMGTIVIAVLALSILMQLVRKKITI
ncbi:hypothetical protein AAHN97_10340 [Chitinophaga niabensis]|uniref:hypothetical protein n=1 Tax=Chitinophaga niabensis TaxID=536979 RepID=UPI0031B9DEAB